MILIRFKSNHHACGFCSVVCRLVSLFVCLLLLGFSVLSLVSGSCVAQQLLVSETDVGMISVHGLVRLMKG